MSSANLHDVRRQVGLLDLKPGQRSKGNTVKAPYIRTLHRYFKCDYNSLHGNLLLCEIEYQSFVPSDTHIHNVHKEFISNSNNMIQNNMNALAKHLLKIKGANEDMYIHMHKFPR